jgi:hypothetical protein
MRYLAQLNGLNASSISALTAVDQLHQVMLDKHSVKINAEPDDNNSDDDDSAATTVHVDDATTTTQTKVKNAGAGKHNNTSKKDYIDTTLRHYVN